MVAVELFFDCSSPWTYLGFESVETLARELAIEVEWKPILVGGVFNAVNEDIYELRANPNPRKATYMFKDLQDWARHADLKIIWPPKVFPVNAVKCMRGCFVAADADKLVPYARAVFQAYWGRNQDISQDGSLREICAEVGLDGDDFFVQIADEKIKSRLRANTDELIERGGFGSPTIFVDGSDMYFGNDRMPLVRDAILRG